MDDFTQIPEWVNAPLAATDNPNATPDMPTPITMTPVKSRWEDIDWKRGEGTGMNARRLQAISSPLNAINPGVDWGIAEPIKNFGSSIAHVPDQFMKSWNYDTAVGANANNYDLLLSANELDKTSADYSERLAEIQRQYNENSLELNGALAKALKAKSSAEYASYSAKAMGTETGGILAEGLDAISSQLQTSPEVFASSAVQSAKVLAAGTSAAFGAGLTAAAITALPSAGLASLPAGITASIPAGLTAAGISSMREEYRSDLLGLLAPNGKAMPFEEAIKYISTPEFKKKRDEITLGAGIVGAADSAAFAVGASLLKKSPVGLAATPFALARSSAAYLAKVHGVEAVGGAFGAAGQMAAKGEDINIHQLAQETGIGPMTIAMAGREVIQAGRASPTSELATPPVTDYSEVAEVKKQNAVDEMLNASTANPLEVEEKIMQARTGEVARAEGTDPISTHNAIAELGEVPTISVGQTLLGDSIAEYDPVLQNAEELAPSVATYMEIIDNDEGMPAKFNEAITLIRQFGLDDKDYNLVTAMAIIPRDEAIDVMASPKEKIEGFNLADRVTAISNMREGKRGAQAISAIPNPLGGLDFSNPTPTSNIQEVTPLQEVPGLPKMPEKIIGDSSALETFQPPAEEKPINKFKAAKKQPKKELVGPTISRGKMRALNRVLPIAKIAFPSIDDISPIVQSISIARPEKVEEMTGEMLGHYLAMPYAGEEKAQASVSYNEAITIEGNKNINDSVRSFKIPFGFVDKATGTTVLLKDRKAFEPGVISTIIPVQGSYDSEYIRAVEDMLSQLMERFNLRTTIILTAFSDKTNTMTARRLTKGMWQINIRNGNGIISGNLKNRLTQAKLLGAIAHEFGHILFKETIESHFTQEALAYFDRTAEIPADVIAGIKDEGARGFLEFYTSTLTRINNNEMTAREVMLAFGSLDEVYSSAGVRKEKPVLADGRAISGRKFFLLNAEKYTVEEVIANHFSRFVFDKNVFKKAAIFSLQWFQRVLTNLQYFFNAIVKGGDGATNADLASLINRATKRRFVSPTSAQYANIEKQHKANLDEIARVKLAEKKPLTADEGQALLKVDDKLRELRVAHNQQFNENSIDFVRLDAQYNQARKDGTLAPFASFAAAYKNLENTKIFSSLSIAEQEAFYGASPGREQFEFYQLLRNKAIAATKAGKKAEVQPLANILRSIELPVQPTLTYMREGALPVPAKKSFLKRVLPNIGDTVEVIESPEMLNAKFNRQLANPGDFGVTFTLNGKTHSYVFGDSNSTPYMLAFSAAHEAFHRNLLGADGTAIYGKYVSLANNNRLVKEIASRIRAIKPDISVSRSITEAMADIYAAISTADISALERMYSIKIPVGTLLAAQVMLENVKGGLFKDTLAFFGLRRYNVTEDSIFSFFGALHQRNDATTLNPLFNADEIRKEKELAKLNTVYAQVGKIIPKELVQTIGSGMILQIKHRRAFRSFVQEATRNPIYSELLNVLEDMRGLETSSSLLGIKTAKMYKSLSRETQRKVFDFINNERKTGETLISLDAAEEVQLSPYKANEELLKIFRDNGIEAALPFYISYKNSIHDRLVAIYKIELAKLVRQQTNAGVVDDSAVRKLQGEFRQIIRTPFVPVTRYGKHTLKVFETITDDSGEQVKRLVFLESYGSDTKATLIANRLKQSLANEKQYTVVKEITNAGSIRQIPKSMLASVRDLFDGSISSEQETADLAMTLEYDMAASKTLTRKFSQRFGFLADNDKITNPDRGKYFLRDYTDFIHHDAILISRLASKNRFDVALLNLKLALSTTDKILQQTEAALQYAEAEKMVRQIMNPRNELTMLRSAAAVMLLWGMLSVMFGNIAGIANLITGMAQNEVELDAARNAANGKVGTSFGIAPIAYAKGFSKALELSLKTGLSASASGFQSIVDMATGANPKYAGMSNAVNSLLFSERDMEVLQFGETHKYIQQSFSAELGNYVVQADTMLMYQIKTGVQSTIQMGMLPTIVVDNVFRRAQLIHNYKTQRMLLQVASEAMGKDAPIETKIQSLLTSKYAAGFFDSPEYHKIRQDSPMDLDSLQHFIALRLAGRSVLLTQGDASPQTRSPIYNIPGISIFSLFTSFIHQEVYLLTGMAAKDRVMGASKDVLNASMADVVRMTSYQWATRLALGGVMGILGSGFADDLFAKWYKSHFGKYRRAREVIDEWIHSVIPDNNLASTASRIFLEGIPSNVGGYALNANMSMERGLPFMSLLGADDRIKRNSTTIDVLSAFSPVLLPIAQAWGQALNVAESVTSNGTDFRWIFKPRIITAGEKLGRELHAPLSTLPNSSVMVTPDGKMVRKSTGEAIMTFIGIPPAQVKTRSREAAQNWAKVSYYGSQINGLFDQYQDAWNWDDKDRIKHIRSRLQALSADKDIPENMRHKIITNLNSTGWLRPKQTIVQKR